MFLPVLLIRDFGWAGFATFAIPNCVGAAAMGWVLWRQGSSEGFVAAHGPMVRLFSLVTFLFHVVWLTQVAVPLAGIGRVRELVLLGTFLTFIFVFSTGTRAAVLAYLVSLAALGVWVTRQVGVPMSGTEQAGLAAARLPPEHILGLIPVCVFGFVFCPYLDGTFHKARQAVDTRGAKVAFGFGFLLFFATMIVFTTMYAPLFGHSYADGLRPSRTATAWVAVHMIVQATFTMGVHLRFLMEQNPSTKRASGWAVLAIGSLFVAVMRMAMSTMKDALPPAVWNPATDGLAWYRMFMGAYGLVFPAYVWICVGGIRHQASGISGFTKPSIEQVKVWVLACAIASPLMYMGFVERRTLLLVPAMGLVFAARWMVRKPAGIKASRHQAIE